VSESPQYDIINKSKHYNQHPSGVECIELAERLSFCAGNAFKYVFRRGEKDDPVQDLKKAIYYLNRERYQMENLIRWLSKQDADAMIVNDHFTRTDYANIATLLETEPNKRACAVYSRVFTGGVKIDYYIQSLEYAAGYVRDMIAEIENPRAVIEQPEFGEATATEI
jgi:hypothetical protein